jgi:phosphatidylserine/phosphatidylglycerophosphate/cardiolipin synthase-like enzyme
VLSFNINLEAGVFFDDPKMVEDLKHIIEGWKKEAKPFDGTGVRFRWYDIPVAFLLRLFGFIPV